MGAELGLKEVEAKPMLSICPLINYSEPVWLDFDVKMRMVTIEQVLGKIKDISLLYSTKQHPLLHIDSLQGQLHVHKSEIFPHLAELAERKLIRFHPSSQEMFMLTDAGAQAEL